MNQTIPRRYEEEYPDEAQMVMNAISQGKQKPLFSDQIVRETPKVGRNEPCPCDSGRKYKKCCGKG